MNNAINNATKRVKTDLYVSEKHLFGEYYVQVELGVKAFLPIAGSYRVRLLQKRENSDGELVNLGALSGLVSEFTQDDIEMPDFKFLDLQQNVRATTHLAGNDYYWHAMKGIYYTILDTYDRMLSDAKKENRYLL